MKMGESGVATVAVLAIVLVSAGTAVATPVVVDTVDVDPDSPFYGLERLGEQIKMVGSEAQMMERWIEYERVVERGKGLEYRGVMQEFVDKLQSLEPENWEAKRELVAWMQEHMPGIGAVRVMVMEQLCERLRERIEDNPLEKEEIENAIREMAEIRSTIRERYADEKDDVRARVQLRLEAIERIANRFMERTGEMEKFSEIIETLKVAEVSVEIKVCLATEARVESRLEEMKENLEARIAELQAMLEGIPENTLSGKAAKKQIELANMEVERAIDAYREGKVGEAFGQVVAATAHIRIAERLAEKASEWEPELSTQLVQWRETWLEIKKNMVQEGTWINLTENPQQFTEQVRERWAERWQEIRSTAPRMG